MPSLSSRDFMSRKRQSFWIWQTNLYVLPFIPRWSAIHSFQQGGLFFRRLALLVPFRSLAHSHAQRTTHVFSFSFSLVHLILFLPLIQSHSLFHSFSFSFPLSFIHLFSFSLSPVSVSQHIYPYIYVYLRLSFRPSPSSPSLHPHSSSSLSPFSTISLPELRFCSFFTSCLTKKTRYNMSSSPFKKLAPLRWTCCWHWRENGRYVGRGRYEVWDGRGMRWEGDEVWGAKYVWKVWD